MSFRSKIRWKAGHDRMNKILEFLVPLLFQITKGFSACQALQNYIYS